MFRTLAAVLILAFPLQGLAQAQDGGVSITLFDDYGCRPAAPPTQLPDGSWTMSADREKRITCGLTGAQAELNEWRPHKDKAPAAPTFAWQLPHTVLTILTALITAEAAVIKSRADRNCKSMANPFAGC